MDDDSTTAEETREPRLVSFAEDSGMCKYMTWRRPSHAHCGTAKLAVRWQAAQTPADIDLPTEMQKSIIIQAHSSPTHLSARSPRKGRWYLSRPPSLASRYARNLESAQMISLVRLAATDSRDLRHEQCRGDDNEVEYHEQEMREANEGQEETKQD